MVEKTIYPKDQEPRIIARFPEENPYPVMRINPEGKLLYANQASEVLIRKWKGKHGARVGNQWRRAATKSLESGENVAFEFRTGNRWFHITAVPVLDGPYINFYGIDITKRHEMEDELHRAGHLLKKMVLDKSVEIEDTQNILTQEIKDRVIAERKLDERAQALEAVYAMATAFDSSMDTSFDQVAVTVAHVLKVPHTLIYEIKGRTICRISQFFKNRLYHKDNLAVPCSTCCRTLQNKQVRQFSGNLHELFENAECFKCEPFKSFITIPITNHKSEDLGMICVMDYREQKFSAYEIHLIQIFARYISHELTRRRLEEQLLQAKEFKTLGQLTSGVAHEVRNPLNGIMAVSEALFRELGSEPKIDPYKKHIQAQVGRLSALMEDLLMLGRSIKKSDFHSVTIKSMINNALDSWNLGNEFPDYTISVHLSPSLKDKIIKVHAVKMEQVFINLFANACNHSPSGGRIVLSVEECWPDMVCFMVSDEGTGFDSENIPQIFEPFFTTRKGGTGLGLSIVRYIIESHGGTVSACNNIPPPGATVEVYLPVVDED
ncbi:MAG: GAF domain-containing protein [Chitinivibrionales bacterium]|nr:GAF domain-containing protein [Chitinivibrionales bacterium]